MDSFIGWIGGKKLLRKTIYEHFPQNIIRYIEVFGGATWLLFYKDKHANFEVYNDINSQLVNLFRCIKDKPEAVQNELELVLNSREMFSYYKNLDIDKLTEIQKAARFYFLIKASFGSSIRTFGINTRNVTVISNMPEIKKRLSRVIIENRDFKKLIEQYDRVNSFFFCDPPYYKAERRYCHKDFVFNKEQHKLLKDILSNIKGRFLLTYNDCEFIRELYKDFDIIPVERSNNLILTKDSKNSIYKELIIKNY